MTTSVFQERVDFRRAVASMYARVRDRSSDPQTCWRLFRGERDELFRCHSQSALSAAQKASFAGLPYFDYNSALSLSLNLDTDVEPATWETELPADGLVRYQRAGCVHFEVAGQAVSLSIFWLMGYGGGLFLPFRDRTNRDESYAGGRYLLDTIKQADLGQEPDGRLVIDFNYAYNPSCAYHSRWHCPLPPPENWLTVPIRAGEKR
jgi:uncharacterized protein (DUF1684 family)